MLFYISKKTEPVHTTGLRALLSNPRYANLQDQEQENIIGLTFDVNDIQKLSSFPGLPSAEFNISRANHRLQFLASEKVEKLVKDSKYWNNSLPKNTFFFPYQIAGAAFALARKGRAMILDPMGLGKTSQAIATILAGGQHYLPAVIVCPLNAFPAWVKDIQTWTTLKPFVLAESASAKYPIHNAPAEWPKSLADRIRYLTSKLDSGTWPDDWIVIVNYEKLNEKIKNVNMDIVQSFAFHMSTVIFDEAHNLRNPLSIRTHKARVLAENIPHALMLTGTPILNAPSEMWAISKMVQPNMMIGSMPIWPDESSQSAMEDRNALFRHYLTTEMGLPNEKTVVTPANWVDYEEYTPEISQRFSAHMKDQAVRRTRKLIASIPGAMGQLPDGRNLQLKQKVRSYVLVDVPQDKFQTSASTEYTNIVRNMFKLSKSGSQEVIIDQLLRLEYWFTDLVYDLLKQKMSLASEEQTKNQITLAQKQFRELYRKGITIPRALPSAIGKALIPAAVDIYNKATKPIIFFTQNHDVAEELGRSIIAADPQGMVLVTLGSDKAYFQEPDRKVPLTGPGSKLPQVVALFENNEAADKRALILTPAGKEGLNLPSADNVVFLQRLATPGDELQAEDRINRPQQKNTPKATYLVLNDLLPLVLFARSEAKRASMLAAMNEDITDDYTNVIDINLPTDLIKNYGLVTGFALTTGKGATTEKNKLLRATRGLQVYGMMRLDPRKSFDLLLETANTVATFAAEEQKANLTLPPTLANVNMTNARMMASNEMRQYMMSNDVAVFKDDEQINWNETKFIPPADQWQPSYDQFMQFNLKYSIGQKDQIALARSLIAAFGQGVKPKLLPKDFGPSLLKPKQLAAIISPKLSTKISTKISTSSKTGTSVIQSILGVYLGRFADNQFFIASTDTSHDVTFYPPALQSTKPFTITQTYQSTELASSRTYILCKTDSKNQNELYTFDSSSVDSSAVDSSSIHQFMAWRNLLILKTEAQS